MDAKTKQFLAWCISVISAHITKSGSIVLVHYDMQLKPVPKDHLEFEYFLWFRTTHSAKPVRKRFQCEHPDRYLYLEDTIST